MEISIEVRNANNSTLLRSLGGFRQSVRGKGTERQKTFYITLFRRTVKINPPLPSYFIHTPFKDGQSILILLATVSEKINA